MQAFPCIPKIEHILCKNGLKGKLVSTPVVLPSWEEVGVDT